MPKGNRVTIIEDQFEDGVQGLPILSGAGTFSEASGNLVYSAVDSENCDWWTFGRNGALAYLDLPVNFQRYYSLYFETNFQSWSVNGPTCEMYFGLYQDDLHWYHFLVDGAGTLLRARFFSGGISELQSTSITLPFKARFIWDTENNQLVWEYDKTGPTILSTWSGPPFIPSKVIFAAKNWGSPEPGFTAQWSYLKVYADEIPYSYDLINESTKDSVDFFDVGGTEKHTFPSIGAGQRIPGPKNQLPGSIGPFEASGAVDAYSTEEERFEFPFQIQPADRSEVFDEDVSDLSTAPQFTKVTTDGEGHTHFISDRVTYAFVYIAKDDPWAYPVSNSLTGYAKDGYEYIAGVKQVTQAPWATETSGNNRSTRSDFPDYALIVVTGGEIVIFDLDDYPNTLDVWLRWEVHSSTYYMMGRYTEYIQQARMQNGVLVACSRENGTDRGRLHIVDFKQTGQMCGNLIGPDNHWIWTSGQTIATRNTASWTTSGVSPSLRISPEYVYSMDMYTDHTAKKIYVACAGEDIGPNVIVIDRDTGVPQFSYLATGVSNPSAGDELGPDNGGNIRQVMFDRSGWLWWSIEERLYRVLSDYRNGQVIASIETNPFAAQPFIRLPHEIKTLTHVAKKIYAGTEAGVYEIDRFTMEYYLAYTIADGGGGGRLNNPPDGEILIGDQPEIRGMRGFDGTPHAYLEVATWIPCEGHGGITVIRLTDDLVFDSRVYPVLYEGGAYFNVSLRQ